jgi:copper chaperone CopZ
MEGEGVSKLLRRFDTPKEIFFGVLWGKKFHFFPQSTPKRILLARAKGRRSFDAASLSTFYLLQILTMEELKFKTNINCNNCIRAVGGFLDDVLGIESWEVDTDNPDKILTVKGEVLEPDAVIEAVEDAGFDIVQQKESH